MDAITTYSESPTKSQESSIPNSMAQYLARTNKQTSGEKRVMAAPAKLNNTRQNQCSSSSSHMTSVQHFQLLCMEVLVFSSQFFLMCISNVTYIHLTVIMAMKVRTACC